MEGYDAITAPDGKIGIELAQKELPDLIICDILMPKKNGYQVLAELREYKPTGTVPFIFLTAKTMRKDFRRGMGLGADDYLTKPFKIEELLEAIETQLEKHARLAKQLEELRMNLSLTLPHEFRTPLTTILGFSELLSDPDFLPDSEEISQFGITIHDSALRLQNLIEKYLLYADLKIMKYDPTQKNSCENSTMRVNQEVVKYIIERKAENYKRANDISVDITEAQIKGTESIIQKVLEELLDNALKFSKRKTPVKIKGYLKDGKYIFTISDEGIGMTEEQINSIGAFIQFGRREKEQQGLGLGLAIAEHLLNLHDGKLKIESIPEKGTTAKAIMWLQETGENAY